MFEANVGDYLFVRRIDSLAATCRVFATVRPYNRNRPPQRFRIPPIVGDADRVTDTFRSAESVQHEGEVVALQAAIIATATKRGQFYLDVGFGPSVDEVNVVAKGYVYDGHALSLGEFVEPGPGGGEGMRRSIQTANPAANTEVAAQAVPTNALWKVRSYSVIMAQGVTDTPHPGLLIRFVATDIAVLIPIGADVAASTTVRCTWAEGVADTRNNVDSGSMVASLPNDLILTETDDIGTSTQGLGANSDYGVASIQVEEWLVI